MEITPPPVDESENTAPVDRRIAEAMANITAGADPVETLEELLASYRGDNEPEPPAEPAEAEPIEAEPIEPEPTASPDVAMYQSPLMPAPPDNPDEADSFPTFLSNVAPDFWADII